MRDERLPFSGNAKAEPACYATSSQHGVRCQRAGQTKSVQPGFCADALHGPQHPAYLVARETIDATRRSIGPREDASGRDKAHDNLCQDDRDKGFPSDTRAGSFSTSSRFFRSQHSYQPFVYQRLQKGSDVAAHCFWLYVMLSRKTLKNFADAAGFGEHASRFRFATWLKSKYEPTLTLKTMMRPSTSAAANLLSRTRTLSIVRVKSAGLHCCAGKPAYLCPIRQR